MRERRGAEAAAVGGRGVAKGGRIRGRGGRGAAVRDGEGG